MKRILTVALILLAVRVSAAEEVWRGLKMIDSPLKMRRVNLRIEPGAQVRFRGCGSLELEYGSLVASFAEFSADSVLTNDFRLRLTQCSLTLADCTFSNLRTVRPSLRDFIFGFAYTVSCPSWLRGNTFLNCSAFMSACSRQGEFADNLFVRCEKGLALLDADGCRIVGNEFFAPTQGAGLTLNAGRSCEVRSNRFTDSSCGVLLYRERECRLSANAFFSCTEAFQLWGAGPDNIFVGNRYEDVAHRHSMRGGMASADNKFIDEEKERSEK